MLAAGVVLQNIPGSHGLPPPIAELDPVASRLIRAGAMALVLVRSGLSLDLSAIRAYGWAFPVFATVPTLLEGLVGGGLLVAMFGMPYLLALSCSFMVCAVGPAIVVAAAQTVKERGFNPRAPDFLMAACCFDDGTASAL